MGTDCTGEKSLIGEPLGSSFSNQEVGKARLKGKRSLTLEPLSHIAFVAFYGRGKDRQASHFVGIIELVCLLCGMALREGGVINSTAFTQVWCLACQLEEHEINKYKLKYVETRIGVFFFFFSSFYFSME